MKRHRRRRANRAHKKKVEIARFVVKLTIAAIKSHIAAKAMQSFSERVKDAKFPSGGVIGSVKDCQEYEVTEGSEHVIARAKLMHERNIKALEILNNSLKNNKKMIVKKSESISSSSGIGFWGLLQIVFITLKLTGYIKWSWWYVLLPSYGTGVLVVILLLFAFIYNYIREELL